jgi:hypothetical protein
MSTLESARRDWEEGHRRFGVDAGEPRGAVLHEQVDIVVAELRRRVGQTFTLDELARAYETSDRWASSAIAEHGERPGWATTVTVALDEAFHRFSRGAIDYVP